MPPTESSLTQTAIVKVLRGRILEGDVAPGQRLVESELSETLGASRGTVRAALIDLTHEGLVERIANRGARVRVVSVEEALEITEVRMVIEALCAAKAAERVTDAEILALRTLGERMVGCVEQGDVIGYSQLNHQLHADVIAIAGLPVAAEMLARLRARNVRHQFRLAYRAGRPQVSLAQHLAIIEAVCDRDSEGAREAVLVHLRSVIEVLRETADSDRHISPTG